MTGQGEPAPFASQGLRREFATLALESLSIHFGGLAALDDVDLEVFDMDLTGLIGPNGAGKTTAFNVITGVYRPAVGRVIFQGRDITDLKPYQIARLGIARTFQSVRLFRGLSVLDNVRIAYHYRTHSGVLSSVLGTRASRSEERDITARAFEFLRLFQLDGRARQPAGSLAYGEQRRLEIARALATEPRLLLLDEPAAGMNPSETAGLMDLISWIREQFRITVLLIEHDMRFVMGICKHIVVLDNGRVIARGAPDEVRSDPTVIKAYLGETRACSRSRE
jgi:branched-chain amino acid transport system ATP-binding protein